MLLASAALPPHFLANPCFLAILMARILQPPRQRACIRTDCSHLTRRPSASSASSAGWAAFESGPGLGCRDPLKRSYWSRLIICLTLKKGGDPQS